ncbi:MAG TPA: YceI family protein [Caulobacteraceae bacterium]
MIFSRKRTASLALGAALSTAALAGATHAFAADWKIDPAQSTLGFSGVQTGARFAGKFKRYNAVIAFDPAHPEAAHVTVTVDLASAATGDAQRDTALPGKDWLDVAQYPQAKFTSSSIRRTGAKSFEAAGTLTIRGVSRPATLPFTLDINGPAAHAKGHLDLIRTAFGVGQGAWASGQWVALQVGVDVDVVARRSN